MGRMGYQIDVWGARGSIPTPGPGTARYGGNTSCLALRAGDVEDHMVILDAGTGIRPLGRRLAANGNGPVRVDLIITHTHWDHIQGLPFFSPFFGTENAVRICGPRQGKVNLERILREQVNPVVFPGPLDKLAAELTVEHVEPGEFEVDGFVVQAMRLRHPGVTLGYRLAPREGGSSVAYIPDNELGSGGDYEVEPGWRDTLVQFLSGVDVLFHDAMYWDAELERHRGWGHSSNNEAVTLAAEAGVDKLVLFHHRPEHDDAEMDRFLEETQEEAERIGGGVTVVAATEGLTLNL